MTESNKTSFPPIDVATWLARVEKELAGRSIEKELVSQTLDGFRIEPLYTQGDVKGEPIDRAALLTDPSRRLRSIPGQTDADWDRIVTAVGEDVAGGADGSWVRIARDEVGPSGADPRGGVAFDEVGFDRWIAVVSTFPHDGDALVGIVDPGMPSLRLRTRLRSLPSELSSRIVCLSDPYGLQAEQGFVEPWLAEAERSLVAFARESAGVNRAGVGVCTAPYHDAGGGPVLELGIAAATLVAYLRLLSTELSLSDAAKQITFSIPVSSDLFVEGAKLRALRVVWAKVLRHVGVDSVPPTRVHAFSSRRTLSRRDPYVNALRITHETIAALLGGADVVSAGCFDEALGSSTAASRRLARNTPLLLARECGLGDVIDPGGGAYLLEALTDEFARGAWEVMREIEREGGIDAALRSGSLRRRVDRCFASRRASLARRDETLVGVNRYAEADEPLLERTPRTIANAPSANPSSASTSSAAASATIEPFPIRRDADPFEALRDRVDRLVAAGTKLEIFLAPFGPLKEYKARQDFIVDLFAAGGISSVGVDAPPSSGDEAAARGEVVSRFVASRAAIVCLVATDERVASDGVALVEELRRAGASWVLCAGRPGPEKEALRGAGVDEYVAIGVDVVDLIERILDRFESNRAERRS